MLSSCSASQFLFPDERIGFAVLFNDVTLADWEQQSVTDGIFRTLRGEAPVIGTPSSVIHGYRARQPHWRDRRSGATWCREITAPRAAQVRPESLAVRNAPRLAASHDFRQRRPADAVGRAVRWPRCLTWLTAWYGWSALAILFASIGLTSAAILVARSIALLRRNRNTFAIYGKPRHSMMSPCYFSLGFATETGLILAKAVK